MIVKREKLILISILISLIILITIIFIVYSKSNKPLNAVCVPTEEIAIEIGKIICENAYPELDYNGHSWRAIYIEKEGIWRVSCYDPNTSMLGGGMPAIYIKKDNAEIVSIGLQT